MHAKLILSLDPKLIRRAKAYAKRSGRSVSSIVADFFATLDVGEAEEQKLGPKVRPLLGVLRGRAVAVGDYRRHLEKRHR
jgi:hypothetical protein